MSPVNIQGKELVVRQAGPEDSLASKQLQESYSEGGRIPTKITIKIEDANAALDIAHPGNYRLLAFLPGVATPVGTIAGWPHMVKVGNSDEIYPAVLVHRLAVHPDYRHQGIAKALWLELDRWIKSNFEAEKVIVYGYYQTGNEASRAWFKSCGGNFTTLQIMNAPIKTINTTQEFKKTGTYTIQELEPSSIDKISEVVNNLNDFYSGFSLYKPHSIEGFVEWLGPKNIGNSTYNLSRYYVAVAPDGKIVAGIGIFDLNKLIDVRVVNPPAAVQLLNKLLKIFPKDGLLKTGQVNQVWYHPDCLEAGKLLWQKVRHRENKYSSNLLVSFDPSSSKLQQLFNFGKFQPASRNNLVSLAVPKGLVIGGPIA